MDLKLVSWERHQRPRNSRHRYPLPDEAEAAESTEVPMEEQPVEKPARRQAV